MLATHHHLQDDVEGWHYSVSLLVKFSASLETLRWASSVDDLGLGGAALLEMLILCEIWAGEGLTLTLLFPNSEERRRPISVSAVPFGPGIEMWRSRDFRVACFVL